MTASGSPVVLMDHPSSADSLVAVSRRDRILDWVGLVARLVVAAVFLVSGWLKAVDLQETRIAVRSYQIFSTSVADTIAAVLPFLELAVGLLLLVGMATRLAAVLAAVLFVVFIAGVVSVAVRGLSIDCGCFGGGGQVAAGSTAYTAEILRDVGLLVLSGFLIWRPSTPLSVDRLVHRRSAVPTGMVD